MVTKYRSNLRQNTGNLAGNQVSVLIDCTTVPVFSARLVKLLSNSGAKVEELALPKSTSDVFKWFWKLKRGPKVVHYLSGDRHPLIYIVSRLLGKKVIIHWIGTDVMNATCNTKGAFSILLSKVAYRMADMHLADFQPLANELRPLGIDAIVVPLVPDIHSLQEDITWPSEDVALVYLPEWRPEFFGSGIVFRLAEELPEIKFLVVAHSGEGAPQLPNIKYLGWVDDMETVWKQVKVYLRLTKHDGLSHTVVEALARAKHVTWSYEFPYCHQARTLEQAKDALTHIFKRNEPNIPGMHYVYSQFEPSKLVRDYKNIYLQILSLTN